MSANAKHMHRPPVLIVAGVFDELVVEGEPNVAKQLCIIVRLQDLLTGVIEIPIANDKAIAASF